MEKLLDGQTISLLLDFVLWISLEGPAYRAKP